MEKTKSTQEEKTPVYYTYKDRVFRMLFKDRKRLHGTDGKNDQH